MTSLKPIPITMLGDSGAQMRVEIKPDVVIEYADDMAGGANFPPVVVYHGQEDRAGHPGGPCRGQELQHNHGRIGCWEIDCPKSG